MKKLAYMLIIISIILIVFGFYGTIKSRNMYKVKKKNVIESYGTIKLKNITIKIKSIFILISM